MMRYPNCRLPGGESMGSYGAKKQKLKLQKVKMVRTVHASSKTILQQFNMFLLKYSDYLRSHIFFLCVILCILIFQDHAVFNFLDFCSVVPCLILSYPVLYCRVSVSPYLSLYLSSSLLPSISASSFFFSLSTCLCPCLSFLHCLSPSLSLSLFLFLFLSLLVVQSSEIQGSDQVKSYDNDSEKDDEEEDNEEEFHDTYNDIRMPVLLLPEIDSNGNPVSTPSMNVPLKFEDFLKFKLDRRISSKIKFI